MHGRIGAHNFGPARPLRRAVGVTATARGERTMTSFDRGFAFGSFALLVFLNVVLPGLKLGPVPIRGLLAVALLGTVTLLYTAATSRALRMHMPVLVLAGAMAVLGIFVSLVGDVSTEIIVKSLMEVHLQIVVTLVLGTVLAEICGTRAAMIGIVAAVGLSAAFAILQAANLDFAWRARDWLGSIQNQTVELFDVNDRARSRGLSYSPVQLSTQLCLAFAVFAAFRDHQLRSRPGLLTADPLILVAMGALFVVAILSGTRSPLLGGFLFLGVYFMRRQGSWMPLMLIIVAALLYLAWPMIASAIEGTRPRVLQTEDQSALGRISLLNFGVVLFADNPLGYGLGFTPSALWTEYWHEIYKLPGAANVQTFDLHNYVLSMLNTYGIGLLLVLPLVTRLLSRSRAYLIFFIPYVVHIMFHNSGPFWNDTIIWFGVAAISAAPALRADSAQAAPVLRTRPSFRRAGIRMKRLPSR